MSKIHIRRDHQLGLTDAKSQVESLAESLKKELHADYRWKGDQLLFQRSGASGTINVGDDFIDLDIKLGMLLSPMKGRIEDSIRSKLDSMLGSAGNSGLA
ncbi:MAG: polyhydroxyalkanoic acid system family protein [Pseudomonadota bacterium]|nr:polyhydroxyalkanoic acid system family protein [Pseudomonadota bacterium]